MNRWKTKKKAKEAESAAMRGPSTDSEHPSLPAVKPSKTFRLGRKVPEPEPKPELDIENALPSSDDFRTSLLMSGLSARFSMLREQDDPTSKIGKASDDSVLFSKRQSRMNDFAFQSRGLADIEEVSSINGSIRPPFAFGGRTDSYHEGYGTDDDGSSIMNRKKPGEGNNLFGGRQKIYKIPASSLKSDHSSGGMGGRALYENDVSQSAFQKLRERERDQDRERAEHLAPEEDANSRPNSPSPTNYNRNRETSSTTSSGGPSNTRSSTAATSVTSQRTPSLNGSHTPVSPALERSVTKNRRLYETGLDQALHEQQHSAMSRIDILARQRTLGAQTPPPGGASPVAMNGSNSDRWDRQPIATKQSMPNLRGASPAPSLTPLNTFDFGVRPSNSTDHKSTGIGSPPLSPPGSENDDYVTLPIQPNDRGKATAMGTFQKPNQPYDDNKYSQRQVQMMQQGRKTPPVRKESPPRSFNSRQQQQVQNGRNRAESNATSASDRSLSNSSAQRNFLPHDHASQSPSQTQASVPDYLVTASSPFAKSKSDGQLAPLRNTEQDPSSSRDLPQYFDPSIVSRANQRSNVERPPESQHPANRHQAFPSPAPHAQAPNQGLSIETNNGRGHAAASPHARGANSNLTTPPIGPPEDSPTLGPGTGLSGMVRQHLRSDSNTSSVYGGMPSAGLSSRFPQQPETSPPKDYTITDNAWDSSSWDRGYNQEDEVKVTGKSMAKKTDSAMPPPLSIRSPTLDSPDQENQKASWERELDVHHTRDGSTETQKERQDFQNELASRRRQVQEHMKSFAETETRSASPIPGVDSPRDGSAPRNPGLGLLKNKSSRGSLVGRPKEAAQSKAMKMLGISNANSQSSPSAKQPYDDSAWRHEEEEMMRGVAKPSGMPAPNKAFRQARREAQRDRERQLASRHQQREDNAKDSQWRSGNRPQEMNSDRYPPNIRTGPRDLSVDTRAPPVTLAHRNPANGDTGSGTTSRSSRDRSSSDASGRSKSRNGRYRDDLAKAMAEGVSSSSHGYEELEVPNTRLMPKSPATPGMFQQSPIPSPMLGLPNGKSRSNSKTNLAGYFDSQKLQTPQGNSEIGLSPRPSPGTPGFSANPTLPLAQTPSATSLATTPTGQGFQAQTKTAPPRKKSINKSEISEPTLISSTSRITTVNLPPGSSLQNGMEQNAPPIPPVNPRRRQTRAMFGAFMGRKDDPDDLHSLPAATQSTEEMSTFSADEGEASQPKIRQKLRKSSSEGGNLNARARQAAFAAPSPALPTSPFPPPSGGSPPRPVDGGMF